MRKKAVAQRKAAAAVDAKAAAMAEVDRAAAEAKALAQKCVVSWILRRLSPCKTSVSWHALSAVLPTLRPRNSTHARRTRCRMENIFSRIFSCTDKRTAVVL